jgi:hypothetical protein
MLKLTVAAACLALSACATPYKSNGLMGGYTASMITPTRAVVSFQGNGFTSTDKVAQYVMLTAAETTHQHGFGHFAIIGEADDSRSDLLATNYGGYGYGDFYSVGGASELISPKTRLTIEMYPGGKPADAPPNVFNAADIINTIRPQL